MKNTSLKYILSLLLVMLIIDNSYTQNDSILIYGFERKTETVGEWISAHDASYELITDANNATKLKVNSGFSIREPGVKLLRTEQHNWNLEGFYQVMAKVTNHSNKEIQVELFVGNDADGLIRWYCSNYIDLKPKQSGTIKVNLAWTPWVFQPQPDVVGMRGIPGKIKTNQSAINELTFCTRYETTPSVFTIDKIWAINPYEYRDIDGFFPFIDKFGQYKHENWEGKVDTKQDLLNFDSLELKDLALHTAPPAIGKYGGWIDGPKLEATGFFRTEKHKSKWWLVDPEGYLFWTAGLNCVSSYSVSTGIQYREDYFEQLPPNKDTFSDFYIKNSWASHGFYHGKTPYDAFNFYQYNLHQKYGNDWLATSRERIHKRLRSWGMNTIGFMSDFGAAQQQKTPYVGSIWISGTPKIEGSAGFWGKFHDVFDPRFRENVRNAMERQKTGAGDPWCIGYFVDNEMSWGMVGSLSIGTLKSPANQPAKIEFVNDLKKKYNSIESLNKNWGTTYPTWDSLLQSTTPPNENAAEDDLNIFYQKIAQTYFRIIKEELYRIAPNQNYLGCRFAWANNDVTLTAAAQYCDIVSFNKYEYSVENVFLPKGVDAPIMIGEFHFGATDRGMPHPGVKAVANQQARGQAYQDYIQGALRNSQIVGAHWFQYLDEPYTGRGDGENYNVGFVSVVDNPYMELIQKVRETLYNMYQYRLNDDGIY